MSFADNVRDLFTAITEPDWDDLLKPQARQPVRRSLRKRREAGRLAYEAAMIDRGMPASTAHIYASAALIWDDDD